MLRYASLFIDAAIISHDRITGFYHVMPARCLRRYAALLRRYCAQRRCRYAATRALMPRSDYQACCFHTPPFSFAMHVLLRYRSS